MTEKTWFLPPDFTFLPDGDVRLGVILKYPDRPTLALDSLDSLVASAPAKPTIQLPEVSSLTESGHEHSTGSGRSASFNLYAKFLELASASGKANKEHYKDLSFSKVDHEIRKYKRSLSPETLNALVKLDPVKKYIKGSLFGRRPVYIISGLRIAKESFSVKRTEDSKSSAEGDISGSVPTPEGAPAIQLGGNLAGGQEGHEKDGYNTAPGIVFGYQLHVIREMSDGSVETELFSDTIAFLTGNGDDESEDEEEMVFTGVTGEMLKGAKEVKSNMEEHVIGDETAVVFTSKEVD
ncbi:hypothetical protein NW768_010168 [Fusarium equiseti]|uniref:Uncharacterized protein n=1 Tax=Fusarium equiseti TaxID=61235 RepID=A0ABQ8R1C4_FUSEQ|nr:hypothetical protein NW768_010168 [Fusarium equiseti]